MKKNIFFTVFLLVGLSVFSQNPNPFPRGIETTFTDPLKAYTTAELNAMVNIPLGRKAFNSDDSGVTGVWKTWDGDSWESLGGSGSFPGFTSLLSDYGFTDNSANWNTAYTNRITSLTTTGTSGAATLVGNVLNIPQYAGGSSVTYGTTAGTAAEGNDSRILNGVTAFGWGDHALEGYLTSYTETDPIYSAWDKDYNDLINTPTIPTGFDEAGNYNPTGIWSFSTGTVSFNDAVNFDSSAEFNGIATFSSGLDVGDNKITSVADPTNAQDAATKAYVDENNSSTQINITSTSGWADYVDTVYTTASPFTVTVAGGVTDLPNNAGTVRDTEKPSDITSFYNGTTITGLDGDAYSIDIEFKVRPTGAASSPRINISIDIGGSVGTIYPRDFNLTKGNGVEHFYLSSFAYYTLDTFETNGGTVKIQAFNEDVEVYDIRYIFVREHKAGNEFVQSNSMTSDMYGAIISSTGATSANPFATVNELPTAVSQLTNDTGYLSSVNIVDIVATGTPSGSTYLRGDGVWSTVSIGTTSTKEDFTATASQTTFVLSSTPNNVDVWINGEIQREVDNYTLSTNTVTLTVSADLNDIVIIRKY